MMSNEENSGLVNPNTLITKEMYQQLAEQFSVMPSLNATIADWASQITGVVGVYQEAFSDIASPLAVYNAACQDLADQIKAITDSCNTNVVGLSPIVDEGFFQNILPYLDYP